MFQALIQIAFYIIAALSGIAAVLSGLRDENFIHESHKVEFEPEDEVIGEKVGLEKVEE